MNALPRVLTALALFLPAISQPAHASPFVLTDTYWGGTNTYPGGGDSIGGGIYNISQADIQRINGGNTLQIVIETAFAGHAGQDAGTGYGALFITPGATAWTPQGTDHVHYSTDTYQNGDWKYALTMPAIPGANQTSGTGGLYLTGGGALNAVTPNGKIVSSNVLGDPITYPYSGNNGYYFRENQAVQYVPGSVAAITTDSWKIENGKITFEVTDNGLLTNDFALSWAITCGNDIIQGEVDLPAGAQGAVPEPSTWAMMILGFAGIGFTAYRRKNKMVRCLASA
jgi:hypothetical protein